MQLKLRYLLSLYSKMHAMKSGKNFKADPKQTKSLLKAGKIATIDAVRHSKALELPITFIENDKIYQELPSGEKVIISEIEKSGEVPFRLTKGMILHAK